MQAEEQIRRTTRAIRRLYTREKQWLGSRSSEQLALLTQEGELQLSEQLHYGEVAFLVLGLKPCVILDYAGDRTQLADYITSVIQPSLRELNEVGRQSKHLPITNTSGEYPRQFNLVCRRIDGELASPEVPNWTGAYALYDAAWEESEVWTKEHLLNPETKFVSENELAKGLDYPGSLPNSVQDARSIVPVSYLGRMK
ncbi:hypothetical protein DL89DRAFT_259598 [Linderina pennispora]|uniref:Uncharacterized protein n=1 Tax=Linderina pennispora TaxID=61395 RepID=A0A1Y1W0N4_9FUNG|nr:uncharacterized protein DL89DRAFT_259598 [Linderina pennispora]ORX67061.1 hypothetical protein DL89DRAFT_259598 [Linderina pennispora]